MARKRMIDIQELVFDPDLVKALNCDGLLVYEILWGNADDFGGFELNLERIKLWCGALKVTTQRIKSILNELIKLKKLVPYEAQGRHYIWLKNFMKHQPIKNPSLPSILLPEWITYEVKQYPSGKKYANYTVIPEKLPVDYQYPTSSLPVVPNRIETNRIETSPETTGSLLAKAQEWLDYFNKKTGKKLSMTPPRQKLIVSRLKQKHALDELKKVVDNFVQDDWPERHKHIDVIYCIGTIKGADKLDHWLQVKPKGHKHVDKITNIDKAKRLLERDQITDSVVRCYEDLPKDIWEELVNWIRNEGSHLKPVFERAMKLIKKRATHG